MRNLLCVAVVAALATFAYIGTADACGGRQKHCHQGRHQECCAPVATCGSGCGAVSTGCGSGHCGSSASFGGCSSGTCGASLEPTQTATVVVELPADARLLIDGNVTNSESARRVFETPALESGREFQYTLEAQVVRDGKTEVITQRITVRAGEETAVRMEMPTTVAAR
jgi:uncharacterized protein (TIGR03000 family)